MKTKTTVIGGGLAGLTAATLLARGGRDVTLYEKSSLGGRAATHSEQGALFNQGPHALYRGGRAMQVLRELGIEPNGKIPTPGNLFAWNDGQLHGLPTGPVTLLSSSLLTLGEKLEFARLLARVKSLRPAGTVGEWLAREVHHEKTANLIRATLRVSTYCNDDALPATLALDQLRLALAKNVMYLHGGWQQLVDALKQKALDAGVRIVEHQRKTTLEGETVLAVTPPAVRDLCILVKPLKPVRAACLDLALAQLPKPRAGFALGIDEPLYFSVHSNTAELGPHHVIQVAKYLGPDDVGADALPELEALTDAMQPGWRDHVVARRFLPEMTVVHALPGQRPAVDAHPGVWLCGDWVGEEGMLADCAFASAAEVARRILATETHRAAA